MKIGYKKESFLSFNETVLKLRKILSEKGFGVITEIDAKKTFREKLDVDFEDYLILGACHPKTAFEVLKKNKDFGLLLPCNIIIYAEKDKVFVSTILPSAMIEMMGDNNLLELGKEIENKLKEVIDLI
jgi:uncharacterized protein (DUF302 family)